MALSQQDIGIKDAAMDASTSKDATISANKIYAEARRMLFSEGKTAKQTINALIAQGVSEETAILVVKEIMEEAMAETVDAVRGQAKRDMLFGAMWCVGGLIATFANFGYFFWGAIIFGAFQFFRGVINLNQ